MHIIISINVTYISPQHTRNILYPLSIKPEALYKLHVVKKLKENVHPIFIEWDHSLNALYSIGMNFIIVTFITGTRFSKDIKVYVPEIKL